MVFPFSVVSGLFLLDLERQREEMRRNGERGGRETEKGGSGF